MISISPMVSRLKREVVESPPPGGTGNGTRTSSPASTTSVPSVPSVSSFDVSGLLDLMKTYAAIENNSAAVANRTQKDLLGMTMDFNSKEAALNRLFQQTSADKSMKFTADQAQLDREFQQSSADKAMKFSADQAQLNRDWQERMSNTAYQRAINDLKAAGLNPILAYSQGGAPVTSGSSASGVSASGAHASGVSASGSSASVGNATAVKSNVASIIGSVLSSNASILSTMMNTKSSEGIADKNRTMQLTVAGMNTAVKLLDSLIPG